MDPSNLLGIAVGVLGLILTLIFERKAARAQRMLVDAQFRLEQNQLEARERDRRARTLIWDDFRRLAREYAADIRADFGVPDAMVAVGPRGAIVAYLLMTEFGVEIPIFTGVSYLKDEADGKPLPPTPMGNWEGPEPTDRCWNVYPSALRSTQYRRVLLVDDWVRSGLMLKRVKAFVQSAMPEATVKSCTIAMTQTAKNTGNRPDYCKIVVEDEGTYFPWGLAR